MKKTSKPKKLKVTIEDQYTFTKPKKIEVEVTGNSQGICLKPKGYDDSGCCGIPVVLEVWNGKLRLVIWGDINAEDPTHIIDLEGAREKLRKEIA